MPFKLNNKPYNNANTPVLNVNLGEGILGKADRNGSILINEKITDPKQREDVIRHEQVHIDQMERGDLDYNDSAVFWKGKRFPRSKMSEGAENLPWEKEAYNKTKNKN